MSSDNAGALALLWVDLETTGTDTHDEIIEVGAVLTDFNFKQLFEFSRLVQPGEYAMNNMPSVVRDMHTENGLLDELDKTHPDMRYQISEVDLSLERQIQMTLNEPYKVMLAGSGVQHFDRRFIQRYMPLTNNLLVYPSLDVGVVRRFIRLSDVNTDVPGGKNHRALDDIKFHIDEAKEYRKVVKNGN